MRMDVHRAALVLSEMHYEDAAGSLLVRAASAAAGLAACH